MTKPDLRTVGELIEAFENGYQLPNLHPSGARSVVGMLRDMIGCKPAIKEEELLQIAVDLKHDMQAERMWNAARERVIDRLTFEELETSTDAQWTEWRSPVVWERLWEVSASTRRRRVAELETAGAVERRRGKRELRFKRAALATIGLDPGDTKKQRRQKATISRQILRSDRSSLTVRRCLLNVLQVRRGDFRTGF